MDAAFAKQDAAFEFFAKLGVPFYCFHDADMAPAGATLKESRANLDVLVDRAAGEDGETGVRLLWGTANLFSHPRYAAGAATNPDPDVFAHAAAQVRDALEATHRLGGANYVLWGGREGYETLLNTDMQHEADQLARFLTMVVEHKHKIGFTGTLLIEPKPQEPTKHQYDYDSATVHGFLSATGWRASSRSTSRATTPRSPATPSSTRWPTPWATGSSAAIDANRGDPQNGWDTDQFPNSVDELSLVLLEILRGGGFDHRRVQLRHQAAPPEPRPQRPVPRTRRRHRHPGPGAARGRGAASPTARSTATRAERYAGWDTDRGRAILDGSLDLAALADAAVADELDPRPVSGKQERLENHVNRVIWSTP